MWRGRRGRAGGRGAEAPGRAHIPSRACGGPAMDDLELNLFEAPPRAQKKPTEHASAGKARADGGQGGAAAGPPAKPAAAQPAAQKRPRDSTTSIQAVGSQRAAAGQGQRPGQAARPSGDTGTARPAAVAAARPKGQPAAGSGGFQKPRSADGAAGRGGGGSGGPGRGSGKGAGGGRGERQQPGKNRFKRSGKAPARLPTLPNPTSMSCCAASMCLPCGSGPKAAPWLGSRQLHGLTRDAWLWPLGAPFSTQPAAAVTTRMTQMSC